MRRASGGLRSGLVALAACACLAALPAVAQEGTQPRTLAVSGEGVVSAAPDTAQLRLGVVREAAEAAEALDRNSAAMQKVLDAVRETGVEERDVQTTRIDVSPQYPRQRPDAAEPPRISGYRVSNQVRVHVRDLDRLGEVVDAVVAAGANEIHGLEFSVAEPAPLLDRARTLAVADAQRRARVLAEAAGVQLGPVLELGESDAGAPPPRPVAFEMARDAGTPVARGEQEFSARVHVTYAIE